MDSVINDPCLPVSKRKVPLIKYYDFLKFLISTTAGCSSSFLQLLPKWKSLILMWCFLLQTLQVTFKKQKNDMTIFKKFFANLNLSYFITFWKWAFSMTKSKTRRQDEKDDIRFYYIYWAVFRLQEKNSILPQRVLVWNVLAYFLISKLDCQSHEKILSNHKACEIFFGQ